MARRTEQQELEQYRRLMEPPAEFANGFNWKTVVGAIFLGFIMMPGSMYLSLVVGNVGSIASASQWVTIILFAEIARRSLKDLKMQEVYILYYMAGLAVSSPFQGLLWNQFLVQSDYAKAMGVAQEIPAWIAPQAETIRAAGRTFFTKAWLAPRARSREISRRRPRDSTTITLKIPRELISKRTSPRTLIETVKMLTAWRSSWR